MSPEQILWLALGIRPTLSQARLKELFDYDPEEGLFRRKFHRRTGMERGSIAGSARSGGYLKFMVDGRHYLVHRLAWLYVFGSFPDGQIDHIDSDKRNNRVANLRIATHAENQRNKPQCRNNKSGFKGVSWHSGNKKFEVAITVNGKKRYLGAYDSAAEGHEAYRAAALAFHGEFANFGELA